jgi:Domain of unknown function (DUF1707)/Domain of unknown function (DUF4190)
VLRDAFAEGRLTQAEHAARVGQAYRARTYAELAAVSADLPGGLSNPGGSPAVSDPGANFAALAHRRTSSLAVAALVCGLIPGLPQLAAIILGVLAIRQTQRTGERGMTLAVAGITLGALGVILTVLFVLL